MQAVRPRDTINELLSLRVPTHSPLPRQHSKQPAVSVSFRNPQTSYRPRPVSTERTTSTSPITSLSEPVGSTITKANILPTDTHVIDVIDAPQLPTAAVTANSASAHASDTDEISPIPPVSLPTEPQLVNYPSVTLVDNGCNSVLKPVPLFRKKFFDIKIPYLRMEWWRTKTRGTGSQETDGEGEGNVLERPVDSAYQSVSTTISPRHSLRMAHSKTVEGSSESSTAHSVTLPVESPAIYCFGKGIYIGKLKELPPPKTMELDWVQNYRGKMVNDLRPVIEQLPSSLSRAKAMIELELCMVGQVDSNNRSVEMKPTVWIRCGSRRCRDAVQKAVADLHSLHTFSKGPVQVHLRSPITAASWTTIARSGIPISGRNPNNVEIEVLEPSYSSACGISVRVTNRATMEVRYWKIGGVINLNSTYYGLSTAHAIFDVCERDYLPFGVESDVSEDDLDSQHENSFRSRIIPVSLESIDIQSPKWSKADLSVFAFASHYSTNEVGAIPGTDISSDFALIHTGSIKKSLKNWYRSTSTNTCAIEGVSSDLTAGDVSIICSLSDVRSGFLLDGNALFMTRHLELKTRKIQTKSPLELGLSGCWVVRGSKLLGIIVAVYEVEPYAHMIPASAIFSDIKSLVSKETEVRELSLEINDVEAIGNKIGRSEKKTAPVSDADHTMPSEPPASQSTREKAKALENQTTRSEIGHSADIASFKRFIVCSSVYLTFLLVQLERTMIPTAIPRITDEFGSLRDIGWYGSAYYLGSFMTGIIYRKTHVYFGLKWTFLSALCGFEIGCLICGLAQNSTMLIIGRFVAGSGASVITVAGLNFMPKKYRVLLEAVSFVISSSIGPLLGGAFVEMMTWRWCFYVNLPFCGISIATVAFLRSAQTILGSRLAPMQKFKIIMIDLLRAGIYCGFILIYLFILYLAGSKYKWSNSRIIALIVVPFALLVSTTPVFLVMRLRWRQRNWSIHGKLISAIYFSAMLDGAFTILVYFLRKY